MFGWLFKGQSEPVSLTHDTHYAEVLNEVGGKPCRLTLTTCHPDRSFLVLVYHWKEELNEEEADKVDSRVRAYVVCAAYDAAIKVGLRCTAGAPHGERPSWEIGGTQYSILTGRYDIEQKGCRMEIGPGGLIGLDSGALHSSPVIQALARGFQKYFRIITV